MKKILITTPSLVPHDAVGNDVRMQRDELRERGYQTFIHSQRVHKSLQGEVTGFEEAEKIAADPQSILIYHHSIVWERGFDLLAGSRCRVLVKYHNITPPDFFHKYDEKVAGETERGRQQTRDIIETGKVTRYIGDSGYNTRELIELGAPADRCGVIAPYTKIDDFADAGLNMQLMKSLLDGRINVLFVGRVVPNKGYHHLIRVVDQYVAVYGDRIRLNLVGGFFPNPGFLHELEEEINSRSLGSVINFQRQVPFQDLHTYFACSHIFLVMSEHEGFCVPLLEAQYHKLPIIALDRAAVAETSGAEQIIFEEADYLKFATAINVVAGNDAYRTYLGQQGHENLQRFRREVITNKTTRLLEEVSP